MVEVAASGTGRFPPPQRRGPGGHIRWAVGAPAGLRSQSWSLFGVTSDDDVYLGPRWQTDAIKLSLHRSGRWRIAWTKEYAMSIGLPDDVDRMLTRWDPPGEMRPGWRHVATVLVTPESLMQQTGERRPNKVGFYPPPNPDGALWFRILIGQPGSELAVTGAIEVGTLRLPSGGMVGVILRPGPLSPDSAAKVAELRTQMLATVTAAGARRSTGFAWGHLTDGAVLLIDTGPVEPKSALRDGAEGSAARGRLTYIRRVDPARPSS